jgi:hypothetical protein
MMADLSCRAFRVLGGGVGKARGVDREAEGLTHCNVVLLSEAGNR